MQLADNQPCGENVFSCPEGQRGSQRGKARERGAGRAAATAGKGTARLEGGRDGAAAWRTGGGSTAGGGMMACGGSTVAGGYIIYNKV